MADNRKLYKEALQTFGHAHQIEKTIEECAELIVELQKAKGLKPCNVQGEIADVEIMCQQMRQVFPGVPEMKRRKLERLQGKIQKRRGVE